MKMKHAGLMLALAVVLTASGCVSAPIPGRAAHVGTWEGIDSGDRGIITLNRDGTAVMQLGGDVYGGEGAELNGKPYTLLYEVNRLRNPSWLDFILKGEDGLEIRRLKGIFSYLSKNQMLLCLSFRSGERPIVFEDTSYNDTLILSRL